MSVTAATVTVFDPQGVVDASTSDDTVIVGPLTLAPETDEAGTPARHLVINTMQEVPTGERWYVVAYHVTYAKAEEDYLEQATRVEQEEDMGDELSSRTLCVGLITV